MTFFSASGLQAGVNRPASDLFSTHFPDSLLGRPRQSAAVTGGIQNGIRPGSGESRSKLAEPFTQPSEKHPIRIPFSLCSTTACDAGPPAEMLPFRWFLLDLVGLSETVYNDLQSSEKVVD